MTFTSDTFPSLAMVELALNTITDEVNAELYAWGYKVPMDPDEDPYSYNHVSSAVSAGAAALVLGMLPAQSYLGPQDEQAGGDRREMLDRILWRLISKIRSRRLRASMDHPRLRHFESGAEKTDEGAEKFPLFKRGQFAYPGTIRLDEDYDRKYGRYTDPF